MKKLRLILGDQLNHNHSWFDSVDGNATYLMMEVMQELEYVMHHIQKVAGFFAAMREFAKWMEKKGHRVIYLRLDDPENSQNFDENISRLVETEKISKFEYQMPDEYRLDQQLKQFCSHLEIEYEAYDSEHFLTTRSELADYFEGKKQYLMESFYRHMRKKHDVLKKEGKPLGGKWNFDKSNRRSLKTGVNLPEPKLFKNDVSDIINMIQKKEVRVFGNINAKKLIWPINSVQALELLDHFLQNLLQSFGTYQDAMTIRSWSIFHSRLSFALNTKMLSPKQVISETINAWHKNRRTIKIQQVEGFVRQILGWREYMRGIYWKLMPGYASMNHFNNKAELPRYYWDADTKMNCMKQAIGQSLDHAYAHHIQRLMITGNFALLAGVDPEQVDEWYLGVYIDAIEWVEITNTRGMSQFADGGIVGTKPYAASANYIDKMSDYCKSCFYSKTRKHGEKACPFNSLYWEFHERNRNLLENNHRLGMVYRTWDKMDTEEKNAIIKQARSYRKNLNSL